MPRVQLPEGAQAISQDGRNRVTGSEGDQVNVSTYNAGLIRRFATGRRGRGTAVGVGTKTGRYCADCRRLWNAWNACCPRCGQPTQPEGEPL